MTESKHTPTPWVEWVCVADVYDEANAAFIVRAANSHDDLVKALTLALPWLPKPLDDEDMSASSVAYRKVTAALAKAGA